MRRATRSELVNEKAALSPEMALRIEKAFDVSMDTLLHSIANLHIILISSAKKGIDHLYSNCYSCYTNGRIQARQWTSKGDPAVAETKQLNIRIARPLYQALEMFAQQERRSVSQAARQLMEDGLRQRLEHLVAADDTTGQDIAALAQAGGAFDWLAQEPDLYDDTSGEPL